MEDAGLILSEDANGVRLVTLNRPQKLNAMNGALVEALISAVDAADADPDVAALVITGSERAFSAGADMDEAAAHAADDADTARRHARSRSAIYRLGARTDKPMIAAVRGFALGGGADLAIALDLVVAGESAVFGYPELKRGLAATMVTPGLVHRIGPKTAFELLTLAENISAERALALGLINRVVPDDAVIDTALMLARTLAAHDGRALRATKRVFLAATRLSLAEALQVAHETMLSLRQGRK